MRATSTRERDSFSDNFPAPGLDEVLVWVSENLEPEDAFEDSKLEEWALRNGFIKDES